MVGSRRSSDKASSDRNSMGRSAKYTALDHSDLEVVGHSDAPEVVAVSSPSPSPSPLNRQSSLHQPEPYHAVPVYYGDDKQQYGGGEYYSGAEIVVFPEEDVSTRPSYLRPDEKQPGVSAQEVDGRKEGRRCCGLRKGVFICLIVAVALLLVMSAVLGGVLGTVLPKDSKYEAPANKPLEVMAGTGLASALSGDDSNRLLTYFQDADGQILENVYGDSTWSLSDRNLINASIVTTAAVAGSPLAAISYQLDGKTYSQFFFVTSTGAIHTTHSTGSTWSPPISITADRVAVNSIGLAACWGEDPMNGIRVFYPSQAGWMQEMKYTFGGSGFWYKGEGFGGSDTSSGVACAVKNDKDSQFLNVYMRWSSSGLVKQVYYDYKGGSGWNYDAGPTTSRNRTMVAGSDIAVCNDESQTEYIHYQMEGGLITRGLLNPSWSEYEVFQTMGGAAENSKLAAAFVDGGAMLLYQNRTSDNSIQIDNRSRYGTTVASGAVP
ncbi:hypothetical protein LTR37_012993 [Vermiconidia calcicola]|uniref:Uncharacterized protein n=1 Tax=Vermiconidia calcicola TaxID=1690605 RepID=A0ACC3MXY1_9PEZI|nr:hypothetical protein LTR37_012993 [Vermiconidia calcicola]